MTAPLLRWLEEEEEGAPAGGEGATVTTTAPAAPRGRPGGRTTTVATVAAVAVAGQIREATRLLVHHRDGLTSASGAMGRGVEVAMVLPRAERTGWGRGGTGVKVGLAAGPLGEAGCRATT